MRENSFDSQSKFENDVSKKQALTNKKNGAAEKFISVLGYGLLFLCISFPLIGPILVIYNSLKKT